MPNALIRVFQRYLVPRWAASAYLFIRYRCLVSPRSSVQLSGRISFGKGTVVKPFVIMATHNGRISIGRSCAVSSFNHISTGDKDLIIGDYVRIGPNVTILGADRKFSKKNVLIVDQGRAHKGVSIGRDVLIGAGAVILPGCNIGPGAVVGAGSVVTGDVPPYTVVAGVPAKVVGKRE